MEKTALLKSNVTVEYYYVAPPEFDVVAPTEPQNASRGMSGGGGVPSDNELIGGGEPWHKTFHHFFF
jgi:hypothetical protein